MKFFDKSIEELRLEFAKATMRNIKPKKYLHAVQQREFLDDVIKA